MPCRRGIEGWTRAFGPRPWVEFQGVFRIPEGIERVAPALRIERMAGEKIDHGVEGEVQWRPVEISIPSPREPVNATEISENEASSPVPEPIAVEPMESKPEPKPAQALPDEDEFAPRPGELLPEPEIQDSKPEDSHS